MTDAEYDALIETIEAYETANPADAIDHGLHTKVAAGTAAVGDVAHPSPMLSLDKAKTMDEVHALLARAEEAAEATLFKFSAAVRALRGGNREFEKHAAVLQGVSSLILDGMKTEALTKLLRAGRENSPEFTKVALAESVEDLELALASA